MSVRLLTALEPRHEAGLVGHLTAAADTHLVRRCPDLADLLAAASAGLADVAVVSAGLRGLERDALAHLREAGVAVVGVIEQESDERRLRQLGVTALLGADAAGDEVAAVLCVLGGTAEPTGADQEWAALESGLDPRIGIAADPAGPIADPEGQEERPGRIVAVWGPVGAPGRTTVAVNLAAELAAAQIPALVIDADTYGASVGQMLGLIDEAPGIAAAARAAELGTLDLPTLARLAPTVEPGFRVLTGLPSSTRWTELRADSMRHLLSLSRHLAAVVIVDIGFCLEDDEELSYDTRAPRRNAAAVATLAAADELLAVGSGDPVGLQRLVRAVQDLDRITCPEPRIVVTKVRAAVAGGAPERQIREVLERFAGLSVAAFVPDDRAACDRALLAGRPLLQVAPKSSARGTLRSLARSLHESAEQPERGRRRIGIRSATIGRWSTA